MTRTFRKPSAAKAKTKPITTYIIFIILVALPVLGVGYLLMTFYDDVSDKYHLRSAGVNATANVTRHESTYTANGRGGGYHMYEIDYTFSYEDETGRSRAQARENVEMPKSQWDKLTEGGMVEVVYLPSDPAVSQPKQMLGRTSPLMERVIAFAVGIVIFLAISRLTRPLGRKYLHKPLYNLLATVALLVISFALGSVIAGMATAWLM